jgi:tetratricopeptide (TPR) repeat protein
MRPVRAVAVAVMALSVLALAAGVVAQDGSPEPGADEVELVRQATLLEAAGDLPGAERALRHVVATRPGSAPALLALERVLSQQRRLEDLLPLLELALAEEPESALLNQLQLRVLSRLDRVDELARAGQAWIDEVPNLEAPYRELARTWEGRGEYERARAVLETGRQRLSAPDALALELGGIYAVLGDHAGAAAEWDRAIGGDAAGVGQVRRRLRSLPDGGAGVIPEMVARLDREPTNGERLLAALELAVAGGLEEVAIPMAGRALEMKREEGREPFLVDLARRADGARLGRLAYWAYGELMRRGGAEVLPAIRARFVELGRELGQIAGEPGGGAGEPGDVLEGRESALLRIQQLAHGEPSAALEALREFRERHGSGADLDRVAAGVGEAMLGNALHDWAERAVSGVRGPRSALLRARLAMTGGSREGARASFLEAAAGLAGPEATRALALASLMDRVTDESAALAAPLAGPGGSDDAPGEALDRLEAGLESLAAGERAALLEFAAMTADDAGLHEDAHRLRHRLVTEHHASPEAPAALLALARAAGAGGESEARELLERLIIEYPRSALVPQARRELLEIRRAAATNGNGGR